METKTKGILRVGTSGIVVPGSKETYPEEFKDKSRLSYYSSLFNTLEVNSTFRKIPMQSTLEKWSHEVSEDFQFTIKLWKEITHIKQLKGVELNNINTFVTAINSIGDKKGCLLIQFPGSITVDYFNAVQQTLQRVHEADFANDWLIAVELRSVSWYIGETSELLQQYNAALVLHDMPKSNSLEIDFDSPFCYFRYHGPKGDYRGGYSNEFLTMQANKIKAQLNRQKDVYVYFNNTMGDAYNNAISLKQLVEA